MDTNTNDSNQVDQTGNGNKIECQVPRVESEPESKNLETVGTTEVIQENSQQNPVTQQSKTNFNNDTTAADTKSTDSTNDGITNLKKDEETSGPTNPAAESQIELMEDVENNSTTEMVNSLEQQNKAVTENNEVAAECNSHPVYTEKDNFEKSENALVHESNTQSVADELNEQSSSSVSEQMNEIQGNSENNSENQKSSSNENNEINMEETSNIDTDLKPDEPSNEMETDELHVFSSKNAEVVSKKNSTQESVQTSKVLINTNIKNTSLGFLQSQYDSSDSDSDAPEEYREKVVEINTDTSDDSDIEILTDAQKQSFIDLDNMMDDDDDDDDEDGNNGNKKTKRGPIRVKGELLLEDLPPIEDLHITVPEAECVELGKIHSIVDQLVLVDSLPGTVPLNLDTVLFLDKGQKVLGEIFDVLGQVNSPLYCVRFNSNNQIKEKGIQVGQVVYVAPRTEHTQFVILPNLINIRGSDASWENDIEPSDKHIEFSDDEEERNYRKSLRNKDHKEFPNKDTGVPKRTRQLSGSSTSSSVASEQPRQQQRYQQNNSNGGNSNYRQRRPQNQNYNSYQNNNRSNQMQGGFRPRFDYDQNSNGSWHSNYNTNNNYGANNQNPPHNQYNQRNFNGRQGRGYRQNNYQQNRNSFPQNGSSNNYQQNPNNFQQNSNNFQQSSNNLQQNSNNYSNLNQYQQPNQNNFPETPNNFQQNILVPNPYAIRPSLMENHILPPPPPPSN